MEDEKARRDAPSLKTEGQRGAQTPSSRSKGVLQQEVLDSLELDLRQTSTRLDQVPSQEGLGRAARRTVVLQGEALATFTKICVIRWAQAWYLSLEPEPGT